MNFGILPGFKIKQGIVEYQKRGRSSRQGSVVKGREGGEHGAAGQSQKGIREHTNVLECKQSSITMPDEVNFCSIHVPCPSACYLCPCHSQPPPLPCITLPNPTCWHVHCASPAHYSANFAFIMYSTQCTHTHTHTHTHTDRT